VVVDLMKGLFSSFLEQMDGGVFDGGGKWDPEGLVNRFDCSVR
jgi:hypothetical protein